MKVVFVDSLSIEAIDFIGSDYKEFKIYLIHDRTLDSKCNKIINELRCKEFNIETYKGDFRFKDKKYSILDKIVLLRECKNEIEEVVYFHNDSSQIYAGDYLQGLFRDIKISVIKIENRQSLYLNGDYLKQIIDKRIIKYELVMESKSTLDVLKIQKLFNRWGKDSLLHNVVSNREVIYDVAQVVLDICGNDEYIIYNYLICLFGNKGRDFYEFLCKYLIWEIEKRKKNIFKINKEFKKNNVLDISNIDIFKFRMHNITKYPNGQYNAYRDCIREFGEEYREFLGNVFLNERKFKFI